MADRVRAVVSGCLWGVAVAAFALAAAGPRPAPAAAMIGDRSPPAHAHAPGLTGPDAALGLPPARPVELGAPREVRIPAIGVVSPLAPLGLNADGTLQVPTDYGTAGWFQPGPEPGEQGPAIVAGHVDSRTGPAVFFRLTQLRAGDLVDVAYDGAVMRFRVDRVERYPKAAFPASDVYGATPQPTLRLITCGGEFDRSTGHYRDNVVVYASLTG